MPMQPKSTIAGGRNIREIRIAHSASFGIVMFVLTVQFFDTRYTNRPNINMKP